jgi:hypothetical protein
MTSHSYKSSDRQRLNGRWSSEYVNGLKDTSETSSTVVVCIDFNSPKIHYFRLARKISFLYFSAFHRHGGVNISNLDSPFRIFPPTRKPFDIGYVLPVSSFFLKQQNGLEKKGISL